MSQTIKPPGESPAKAADETCTCRKCGATYVPSFLRDFYPDPEPAKPGDGLCEQCMMSEAFAAEAKPAPVAVDEARTESLCRKGQDAATCSYLAYGTGSYLCAKGSNLQATIDQRRAAGNIGAKGDNCSGPPKFEPTAAPV